MSHSRLVSKKGGKTNGDVKNKPKSLTNIVLFSDFCLIEYYLIGVKISVRKITRSFAVTREGKRERKPSRYDGKTVSTSRNENHISLIRDNSKTKK